ncbi:MAG: translation initiation factor IF-2 [Anaerolineae bacterium UTCFX2]|jgi:translation initiation factor IF-2|nr:translation initiation factor IF-2 [Anaerolineales bacterium]OQY93501.1 MAG: translation initiation factor IF-2 [Anaerolineae bacterium UTCFX2]
MSDIERHPKTIELPPTITVRELANSIQSSPIEVIKSLMSNGVMANINQQIDFDTAAIIAAEMGYEATLETLEDEEEERGEIPLWRRMIAGEDQAALTQRPPVVTILGHVDHGKTTLLDAIRHTDVAAGEAGGITQHIGAYQVEFNGRTITFLDTPGHSAFTAMRARGAQGADIVILVVAADDGVMPQTREAIAHAKAARVPIIVALNKTDRPNADQERVKQQLAENGLVPDDWDGDTIVVPISAKKQQGIEDLLEAILLVAENMDIQANPKGKVIGTVIEAELDKSKGVLASLLVQNGTLKVGDEVVAGIAFGRLRAMFDHYGRKISKAGPSTPVSVMGLSEVPPAGELFYVVDSEREARDIVNERHQAMDKASASPKSAVTLEQLFDRFQAGEVRELRMIIKADVQGSLEPIVSSLNDLSSGDININILHAETGNITESDVMLAAASKAVVIGFNVSADAAARRLAEAEGISIRNYEIIYRLTEDVEKALKGMLPPEEKENTLGHAEVRAVFRISKLGNIAGCKVVDGEIRRNARIRVFRQGKVIHEGPISSLKHLQEDVREVRTGFECGIGIKNFDGIEVGDKLECYTIEKAAVEESVF